MLEKKVRGERTYRFGLLSHQGEGMSKRFTMFTEGVGRGSAPKPNYVCVIAKGNDARIGNIHRQQVFGPKNIGLLVSPCAFTIPSHSMHKDEALEY